MYIMPRFINYDPRFQYYNPYQRPDFYNNYNTNIPSKTNSNFSNEYNPTNKKKPNSDDPVWLDLFGIKLYFDDVLILSLLFFLYKEEVKDEGLFLALVLLLIS